MTRILFTTPILGIPAFGGPELRVLNSIKVLSVSNEVFVDYRGVLSFIEHGQLKSKLESESNATLLPQRSIQVKSKLLRKLYFMRRILIEKPIGISNQNQVNFLLGKANEFNCEVIWFGYGNISYSLIKDLRRKSSAIKIICDTDSVWSRFIFRSLPFIPVYRKPLRFIQYMVKVHQEKKLLQMADLTTAVSRIDQEHYARLCKAQDKTAIFSNCISDEIQSEILEYNCGLVNFSICLTGTFGHKYSSMDVAARWMIDCVMPLVNREEPSAVLYLVGKNSDAVWGREANKNLVVTGKVLSAAPYIVQSKVIVVPLKFESGTRFKILEAGILCKPIVTTSLGAEGLPVVNREHLIIADTAERFAGAILEILRTNIGKELGENCAELVRSEFLLKNMQFEGESILAKLIN